MERKGTHVLTDVETLAVPTSKPLPDEPLRHLFHINLSTPEALNFSRLINYFEQGVRVDRAEGQGLPDVEGLVGRVIMSRMMGSGGGKSGEEGEERDERCGAHDES